jgi:hypothetical protein
MKRLSIAFITLLTLACNNPENTGYSTPVDSSNIRGTAGATYGPDDPAAAKEPKYQGSYDTGIRANTANSEDSAKRININRPR